MAQILSLEDAAKSGNIDRLYELIKEDPYVLAKIDNVPFIDTPLHVAAAEGKTEFAMEIMHWMPSFARKPNADGDTPLHLAVGNGHLWLVLELVKVDPSLVRLQGREGMTPLLSAVNGNKIDIVSEFFLVCHESIVDVNVNGENALHIALKNKDQRDGLILLKVLMGWIRRLCQKDAELIETRVLNRRDKDGNTPLHIAAYNYNQQAMISMLKGSTVNINVENKEGLTVLDVAKLSSRDKNTRVMERLVKKHGGKRLASLAKIKTTSLLTNFMAQIMSLQDAAKSGNIDRLYELIKEDPYVLAKIDNVPFIDTPLHVAAAEGKTEFAMEVMNLMPSFARKLNADGVTPLHLAVDRGHFWLVLEFVKVDPSLVRLKGRHGMTPLLSAISRNKVDIISEFFLVCPESIVDANVNGENAFHIAVKNNDQREGVILLDILTGWLPRLCKKDAEKIETRVINQRDNDGNTPLHLAAYNNNLQAVQYIEDNNITNMERLVIQNGGKHSTSLLEIKTTCDVLRSRLTTKESGDRMKIRNQAWMSEEKRNALLVVATLIITSTYQIVLQPPGGLSDGGGTTGRRAGTVVMTETNFILIWMLNSGAFYLSIALALWTLSFGQESSYWYYSLFAPLFLAYYAAGGVISPSRKASLIGWFGTVMAFIIYMFAAFKWYGKMSKRTMRREPKSGLVWEGFSTFDHSSK
ncbi:unnamed protein product [Cochlearia groenlandica]